MISETPVPAPFEVPLGDVETVAKAVADTPSTPAPVKTIANDVATAASDTLAGNGTSSVVTGLIRTAVPLGVAAGITYLSTLGLNIPKADEVPLDLGAVFVVGSLYYFIVRKLEARWPKLGWLLGSPSVPVYGS